MGWQPVTIAHPAPLVARAAPSGASAGAQGLTCRRGGGRAASWRARLPAAPRAGAGARPARLVTRAAPSGALQEPRVSPVCEVVVVLPPGACWCRRASSSACCARSSIRCAAGAQGLTCRRGGGRAASWRARLHAAPRAGAGAAPSGALQEPRVSPVGEVVVVLPPGARVCTPRRVLVPARVQLGLLRAQLHQVRCRSPGSHLSARWWSCCLLARASARRAACWCRRSSIRCAAGAQGLTCLRGGGRAASWRVLVPARVQLRLLRAQLHQVRCRSPGSHLSARWWSCCLLARAGAGARPAPLVARAAPSGALQEPRVSPVGEVVVVLPPGARVCTPRRVLVPARVQLGLLRAQLHQVRCRSPGSHLSARWWSCCLLARASARRAACWCRRSSIRCAAGAQGLTCRRGGGRAASWRARLHAAPRAGAGAAPSGALQEPRVSPVGEVVVVLPPGARVCTPRRVLVPAQLHQVRCRSPGSHLSARWWSCCLLARASARRAACWCRRASSSACCARSSIRSVCNRSNSPSLLSSSRSPIS
ncbi:hypothetical protein O0L34_g11549 [Tuta absoluta]|nr:hypothetical protein O0L34_g11549 [Tuta absoluta]